MRDILKVGDQVEIEDKGLAWLRKQFPKTSHRNNIGEILSINGELAWVHCLLRRERGFTVGQWPLDRLSKVES